MSDQRVTTQPPTMTAPRSWVIVPEPRPTPDVPYHHDRAPGQKYLILADSVVPGSPIYVALRRINEVPPEAPRWLDPHGHTCNSFYIFLGDAADLSGLQAMATIGDLTFPIAAPATVLIPPRTLHHYWYTAGSGWYVQVTLTPEYTDSLAPAAEMGQSAPNRIVLDSVYQPARRRDGEWELVTDGVFAAPGITMHTSTLPMLPKTGPSAAPGQVTLDILVSQGAAPLQCQVVRDGAAERLATPIGLLRVGSLPLAVADVQGAGLAIRLAPDVPFGAMDPGANERVAGRSGGHGPRHGR